MNEHSLPEDPAPSRASIERRIRAAMLLDLPAEATPAEARSAFLKRLDRVDFAPSDDMRAGLGLLDERLAAASFAAAAVENARRDMLGNDVDEFSLEFWAMSPAKRRERWQSLCECCAKHPALIKYLQQMEPGLDVGENDFLGLTDPIAQIAGLIKECFPLRRLERTVRRQEWLAENSGEPVTMKQAANQLSSAAPALAALDPDLLNEIRRRADRPKIYVQRKSNGWPAYLILVAVFGILWASSRHSDHNSNHSPPPPAYTPSKGQKKGNAALVATLLTKSKAIPLNVPQRSQVKAELLPLPREVETNSPPSFKSTPPHGDRP